jgi:hypothetical protein
MENHLQINDRGCGNINRICDFIPNIPKNLYENENVFFELFDSDTLFVYQNKQLIRQSVYFSGSFIPAYELKIMIPVEETGFYEYYVHCPCGMNRLTTMFTIEDIGKDVDDLDISELHFNSEKFGNEFEHKFDFLNETRKVICYFEVKNKNNEYQRDIKYYDFV